MDETQAVTPTIGNEAPTTNPVQDTGAADNGTVASPETSNLSVENLQKQLAETRKEAANYRRKLRDIEQQQQEAQAELERKKPLEERLTTYEQQIAQLAAEKEQLELRTLETDLKNTLLDAGVSRDMLEDALELYVAAVQRVEEGEEPSLEEWLKSRTYLMAKPAAQPIPGANPAGKQVSATLTRGDIAKMTPEEYAKNRSSIFAAMARGLLRK